MRAKFGGMKTDKSSIMSGTVGMLVSTVMQAVAQTVPPLMAPGFADTEVSTNVIVTAWTQNTRNFSVALSLDATPSNNVQVAFGFDADSDECLTGEETGLTWLFDKDWDLLKVTARGVDFCNENVSVQFGSDPAVLLMR